MTVTGHQYTSTRVRGLAPWNPKAATMAVLHSVNTVLEEYRTYLPMTARQVFYRLVGAHGYDKTERAYSRLLEYLNRGRRAGLIPWSSIRDDGFDRTGGGGWDNPQQVIDSAIATAEGYERDHQDRQPFYTEMWVEAAGMMPQVARMVRDYSIPVYSSGGFNSTTSKHQTASRIVRRWDQEERDTRVLHIGDYDPSGVAVIDSLASDLWQFIRDMEYATSTAHFVRVAVTPGQIEELALPGAPPKANDRRGDFTDLAVQAEALSPPQLEEIVLDEVRAGWDDDAYQGLLVVEAEERATLVEALEGLTL